MASANEGGGEGGGGEGKAAGPPREQREYTDKTTKMNALVGKIEEATKRFEELTHEKEGGESERSARRKEMVEVARQREKDEAEYARLKAELAQRYPNKGERGHRAGEHTAGREVESHAEDEKKPTGLDALLDNTKELIDAKYAPFTEKSDHASRARGPASDGPVKTRPRLRLER